METEKETNTAVEQATEVTEVTQTETAASHTIATAPVSAAKKPNTLLIIAAILVVMAGIQVFQTQQLLAAVSTGSINAAPAAATQQGGSALPSQVGGCG